MISISKLLTGSVLSICVILCCCQTDKKEAVLIQRNTIEIDSSDNSMIVVDQINYNSDNLNIGGYLIKPKEAKNQPVILYIRGGNRDFGSIGPWLLNGLKYFARNGYVVLVSQLRGNSFSDGSDEMGGEDVNDLLALIELAKELDETNHKQIGVYGFSRGGMMALILSKISDDIQAVVTLGAPTDLFLSARNRPTLYENVYLELIGDSLGNRNEYIERSAVYWSEELDEPLLMLHGESDEHVNVDHTLNLVSILKKRKKKDFEFKIYESGFHGVNNYAKERDELILDWFDKYIK